jgi:hypothetical protein
MRFLHSLYLVLVTASLFGACQALDSTSPVAVPNQIAISPSPDANTTNGANPLPGGVFDQSIDSPLAKSIRDNAQNLLNQKYPEANIELQTLHSFQTQVVAGMNYLLDVDYTDQGVAKGRLMLKIYKDLEDHYTLTQDNYPG